MSKRFATIFFISVATLIVLVVIFFLILFLAPGVSIFGLRYIGAGLHDYTPGKQNLYEKFGGIYRGITINTYEVPVNIKFTEDRFYEVEYYDKFSGLTTTKIDEPSMDMSFTNGIITIDIAEYHKFIWQNSTSTRYVNLYVPLAYTSNETSSNSIDLVINSTNSTVTFSKDESADARIPSFNSVKVKTNGKVFYKTAVKAETYTLETSRSISVNADKSNIIAANSYNLKSTSGKVTVECDLTGDLTAETANGAIKLMSCRNLYAKSNFGSISYAGKDDKKIQIKGVVDISTKAGSVTLGSVEGVGENKISTVSGSIYVEKILDGTATSQRGRVEIKSVRQFKIETNVGKVFVQEALTSIDVTTKRGEVHLGGENMKLLNPKVFSRIGKVYVNSADGNVDIETVSSDITFKNLTSDNIKINCGGKLSAEKLTGQVDIYVEEDSTISFSTITANSTISFGEACKNMTIRALNNTLDDTGFIVKGKRVVLQQYVDGTYVFPNGQGTNNESVDNSLTKQFPYVLKVGPADSKKNNVEINLIIKG